MGCDGQMTTHVEGVVTGPLAGKKTLRRAGRSKTFHLSLSSSDRDAPGSISQVEERGYPERRGFLEERQAKVALPFLKCAQFFDSRGFGAIPQAELPRSLLDRQTGSLACPRQRTPVATQLQVPLSPVDLHSGRYAASS